eukprot:c12564_g1_i3.p1 GENE.c12564_g1_i3~~c12564_g1_i3.p1  ORF type:complete len:1536 (+),score=430.03 c12564_g1_i3:367-4608(+)
MIFTPSTIKTPSRPYPATTKANNTELGNFTNCGVTWNDPLWVNQWHLCNPAEGGVDANVTGAWAQGFFGEGIQIAIVDDGVQYTHPDISSKYDAIGSFDFNDHDTDPMPLDKNHHGTACAGVAAAAAETTCGVGVAPHSRIAGIRLIAGSFTTADEIQALTYRSDRSHIFSNSWGPTDCSSNGCKMDGPNEMATLQIESHAKHGRNGLGTIYLWAAGNGGEKDDTNMDGFANSIYVIAVGASNDQGVRSEYSERGAAIHISAPSSDRQPHPGITTSDLMGSAGYTDSSCTNTFGGTSSATPLVAGVVALILEANPLLSWRDVKHVLKVSATRTDPVSGGWVQNGGGVWVSHSYGFGVVNAGRAVELARQWQPLPPLVSFSITQEGSVLGRRPRVFEARVPSPDPIGSQRVTTVEMVEVYVWITCVHRGSVTIELRSPSGTTSILAKIKEESYPDYDGWRLMSVQHWGESAVGVWQLTVFDLLSPGSRLVKWNLALHGSGFPMDASECGNGIVETNEQCDDGNTVAGDGCSGVCLLESGWRCATAAGAASKCVTDCGDGLKLLAEGCDDGNVDDNDGCDALCVVEPNFVCPMHPLLNVSRCFRIGSCNGTQTHTALEGTITDNNYPHQYNDNQKCRFLIQPPVPTFDVLDKLTAWIQLTFTRFDTENGYDFVVVYDGPTEDSPLLGSFSGTSIPLPIRTTQPNAMLIVFKADPHQGGKGFAAEYAAVVGTRTCAAATLVIASEGSIDDGSGIFPYSRSQCMWLISPEDDTFNFLTLTFHTLDINQGDHVFVLDGDTLQSPMLSVFQNDVFAPDIVRSSPNQHSLLVVFDGASENAAAFGFEASFGVVTSFDSTAYPTCKNLTVFTDVQGTFEDGSDQYMYQSRITCLWLIAPTGVDWIKLSIDWISTEASHDKVTVYNGNTTTSHVIGEFSGDAITRIVISTGPLMLIEFTSDEATGGDGFAMHWDAGVGEHECSGNVTFDALMGSFSDGSKDSNYINFQHCEWLIAPSEHADWITLHFTEFDTELNYDIVHVFDGDTATAPLLLSASGNMIPRTVTTSQGKAMLVVFRSDSFATAKGFRAEYLTGLGDAPVTQCQPTQLLIDSSGEFSSNEQATTYVPSTNCEFLISPGFGYKSITLSFLSLETELARDTIRVFDGSSTRDRKIGIFFGKSASVVTLEGSGEAFGSTLAENGVKLAAFPTVISRPLVIADPADGCAPLANTASTSGNIVLLMRGVCLFTAKAARAFEAGAVAVIIQNNEGTDDLVPMGGDFLALSIPVMLVSMKTGSALREAAASNLGANVTLASFVQSTGNEMLVTFSSDSNDVPLKGFEAQYTAHSSQDSAVPHCTGSEIIREPYGTITLQASVHCRYIVLPSLCQDPPNGYLELSVYSESAMLDGSAVMVYDGPAPTTPN